MQARGMADLRHYSAGRKVTIVQNDSTMIENRKIPGMTGAALDSHEGLPGPIYLDGGEQETVSFNNIVLAPVCNGVSYFLHS